MLQALRARRQNDDEGFTLIELMVVVLIIAILLAIAIPTFLGARQRAQNRAAQSNIRNAFTAEKTYYTDAQAYTSDTASITSIEPSLSFINANPNTALASGRKVYIQSLTPAGGTADSALIVLEQSAAGNCYWLYDVSQATGAGTFYGQTSTACSATAPTGASASSWS